VYTVTEVIPVTITEHVDYTVGVPVTSRQTVTGYTTIVIPVSVTAPLTYTSAVTYTPPPVTYTPPPVDYTTPVYTPPANTTKPAIPTVSTGGANKDQKIMGPAVALVAGLVAAFVLI
jgi:hypothetical protein